MAKKLSKKAAKLIEDSMFNELRKFCNREFGKVSKRYFKIPKMPPLPSDIADNGIRISDL